MAFPATRKEMEDQGYKCMTYTRCRGCDASMEFWHTPKGGTIPMDPMPLVESPAVSHYATCPNARRFRKKKP